jgi:hypothetical protein
MLSFYSYRPLRLDSASRILRQTTLWDYLNAHRHEAGYKDAFQEYCVGRTVLTRYNNKMCKHIEKSDRNWGKRSEKCRCQISKSVRATCISKNKFA